MAQSQDRWASKILALPIFSDEFAQAILRSPYSNLALIAAMEVHSAGEFVVRVHEWSSSVPEDSRDALLMNGFMLEQYWSLASSIEKALFESTANQLGFGMCDPVTTALSAETASARQARAVRALLERPAQQPRKILKKTESDPSATPLLNQETAARWKWAAKLEEIGRRAGLCSKLLVDTANSEGLSTAETARLRQLVLSSGAPRTMAAHISTWERFEEWLLGEGIPVFPLSSDMILKYALFLDQRECGPTVVPSLRTAIRWVTSKLAIDCPDLAHAALLAVQAEIVQKRATTLKEANPIPIEVIGCMEKFVVDEEEAEAARLFVWWWLCMVFASLRFDDAVHVKPSELILTDEGLFGVAWQTKVERKRRGTKFVVPHVGFADSGWLLAGWSIFQLESFDRDYWMRDLNTRDAFRDAPAAYQRSVQWLRHLAKFALKKYFQGEEQAIKLAESKLHGITAHSARVTLLDAAVHAGRSTEEIGLQANWKNPGPARFEVHTESHACASSDGSAACEGHGRPLPPVRGASRCGASMMAPRPLLMKFSSSSRPMAPGRIKIFAFIARRWAILHWCPVDASRSRSAQRLAQSCLTLHCSASAAPKLALMWSRVLHCSAHSRIVLCLSRMWVLQVMAYHCFTFSCLVFI